MKLVRFGKEGQEKPGILSASGKRRDLSGYFEDWNRSFFDQYGPEKLAGLLRTDPALPVIPASERWGSCIARPGKVICIGLNYSDHARESGMAIPAEPIIFQKAANTVVGPYDNVLIPRGGLKTDWEIELGIVIGKTARYLSGAGEAEKHIAGYCISHDVSERAFQMERGGQWTKGKSCDNFNPLGPFLATPDEVKNVQGLSLTLSVNGVERQHGNTENMIFDCPFLVHYLSQFMTLEPGDLISTGTPAGVGFGLKPAVYLKEGDIVDLAIEGLGAQRQVCVNA